MNRTDAMVFGLTLLFATFALMLGLIGLSGCAGAAAEPTKPVPPVQEVCPDPWVLCLDEKQADLINAQLAAAAAAMRRCAEGHAVQP